jgi:hypothetical protein
MLTKTAAAGLAFFKLSNQADSHNSICFWWLALGQVASWSWATSGGTPFVDPSAFIGTDPMNEPITSGFPAIEC